MYKVKNEILDNHPLALIEMFLFADLLLIQLIDDIVMLKNMY